MPSSSIENFSTIDESNYLLADFRDLLNNYSDSRYASDVERFWEMGRALGFLEQDGILDRSGGVQNFYLEAIRWIKGQANTNNWVGIPPITSMEDSNRGPYTDQFFQQWLPNFYNSFFSQPILNGYFATTKHPHAREVTEAQKRLLEQSADSLVKTMKLIGEEEQEKIIKASSLKEWQGYFDDLVSKVPDDKWKYSRKSGPNPKLSVALRNKKKAIEAGNYLYLQKHHKFWKSVWLACFAASIIGTFIVNQIFYDYSFLEILPVKIAFALFFGTLYESTNKNYRIYSNLLDQTRYRSLVAKTIQSIILDDQRFDAEQKKILFAVAAQTLFEMRNSGHLTKKDSSSPASELLTSIIAGRTS